MMRIAGAGLLAVAGMVGLSTGVAAARPFCFETGPGYQKCVNSGHDLTPIYQGPKIYEGGNVPWIPDSAPSPIYIPQAPIAPVPPVATTTVPLERLVQSDMQGFFDNPANDKAQYNLHFGRVSLTQTGDTTYEGVVAVSAGRGPEQDIPVHVTSDGYNAAWNFDPGALMPLFN